MRDLALNLSPFNPPLRSIRPGTIQLTKHSLMKAIETVISIIAFILLAIVLFALSPLLIKMIEVANHVNHFFGN